MEDVSIEVASSPLRLMEESFADSQKMQVSGIAKNTKGGWKMMPFIIGNAICANLAFTSLYANMVVFLTSEYHMDKLTAAQVTTIWSGIHSLAPIVGAFMVDSYLGSFWAILLASITYIAALGLVTLISIILSEIRGSGFEFGLLFGFFGLMVVGTSGMKSCALPFGAEQFDSKDSEGRKQQQRFINYYYFAATLSIMVGATFLVYLQSNVSWTLGFGLAAVLMVISTGFFLVGTNHYVRVSPEGSALTGYAQVIVASIRKRNLVVPSDPIDSSDVHLGKRENPKICLTDQFKFLNKAAIETTDDLKESASQPNPWTLCTVQKIEELKSVLRVMPIWTSGMTMAIILLGPPHTYMIYQAQVMHRKIGPNFEIPAASYTIFSVLAMSIWLPVYNRKILPFLRQSTNRKQGITVMERIGTGYVMSVLVMTVSALVEVKRRKSEEVISGFWLAPQYIVGGLAWTIYATGMIEFLNVQMGITSTAVALFWCSMGVGLLCNSVIMALLEKATGGDGHQGWLPQNLNEGSLDSFYWFLALLGLMNLFYFLACTRFVPCTHHFVEDEGNKKVLPNEEDEGNETIELSVEITL